MKYCPDCGRDKPLSEFGRDIQKSDGLRVYCRTCVNTEQRLYDQSDAGRKYRAHKAVQRAVKRRDLDPAKEMDCLHCGEPAHSWHHWMSYAVEHWFWILPLCTQCHWEVHKISTPSVHGRGLQDQSATNSAHECGSFVGAGVRP